MSNEIHERLRFAERIAIEAGESTLKLFHSPSRAAEHKADGSPVTQADRAAEQLLRDRIGQAYPDDAILGEEFEDRPGTSGYRWVLDPIDGTESFVHGVPLYGTLVACEYESRPQVGVIHMPALGETVAAAVGGPSWWRPAGQSITRPLCVTDETQAGSALGLWTCPEVYRSLQVLPVFQSLERQLGMIRGWSDCYAYVLLATGRADAVIEAGLKHWDYAAALPVLHEAGARITDWNGGNDLLNGQILASNALVHDQILAWIESS